jgi:hypothetical protein
MSYDDDEEVKDDFDMDIPEGDMPEGMTDFGLDEEDPDKDS